jgi:N-acetylmuramoyl-L-alanine amidase
MRGFIHSMKDIAASFALLEFRPAHPMNFMIGRSMNGNPEGEQAQPTTIVIHVADGKYSGTLAWFADKRAGVSAHYTVAQDGRIGQSVQEYDTAFHSGRWSTNVTSFGIEHEGEPSKGYWQPTEEMYQASARLAAYLCYKYGIAANRKNIIGHNEVDPTRAARHNCPGPTWNWSKYMNMVNDFMDEYKGNEAEPAHNPTPDANRPVTFVLDGGDRKIGQGTLVAGTNKVYYSLLDFTAIKLGAPNLTNVPHRLVRIFDPATNKQIAEGVYIVESAKVYIVKRV